jgi:Glycosyl transferase family 2
VLTVIVPAHNEGRVIGRLLDRLVRDTGHQDLDLDIIVVANGSTDDSAAIADSRPCRLVLSVSRWSITSARSATATSSPFPASETKPITSAAPCSRDSRK